MVDILQIFTRFSGLVGIASSVLMLVIRLVYWLFTRKRMKLYYQIIINDLIFHPDWKLLQGSRSNQVGQKQVQVEVTYADVALHIEHVNAPGFVEVEIRNAGNVDILSFSEPIRISFRPNTLILRAEVTGSTCPVGQLILVSEYEIDVPLSVMNVQNSVKVQILLERNKGALSSADKSDPNVSCHAASLRGGISKYDSISQSKWKKLFSYATCLLCLLALVFLWLALLSHSFLAFVSCAIWLLLSVFLLIARFV